MTGVARADTMTAAVDIPFTTCTTVASATYVVGTACAGA
ncbi:MAG: hypothetical protein ACJAVS_001922 [Paracoccaceae bacterium]|jgi:hypothetical protein